MAVPCIPNGHHTTVAYNAMHHIHDVTKPLVTLLLHCDVTWSVVAFGRAIKLTSRLVSTFRRYLTPYPMLWCYIIKTHVRGFFEYDLHEVSWHFATHEAVRPSGFKVQLTEWRSVSKKPFKMGFWSPWRLIVLVRSLRSARLDAAWLVKSVTYFNLIG